MLINNKISNKESKKDPSYLGIERNKRNMNSIEIFCVEGEEKFN